MARIALGGLTTLNLGTHLDPMFTEIYSGAFAGFTFANGSLGVGTAPVLAIDISRIPPAAGSDGVRFTNGSGRGYQLMLTGTTYSYSGVGASEVWLYGQGATPVSIGPDGGAPIKFITNGSERARIDSSGNFGVGVTPTCKLDLFGNFLLVRDATYSGYFGRATDLVTGAAATDLGVFCSTGSIFFGTNAGVERLRIATTTGHVTPGADNGQALGSASRRWSTVFAGTGAINTSDAREKTPVTDLSAAEISAAQQIARELGKFKFLQAVEAKGDEARTHIGMTVQRAMEILEAHGLEPFDYAFICYDQWGSGTAEDPSGDRYSFRSDELALFVSAGQQAAQDALEARIAALEAYDK